MGIESSLDPNVTCDVQKINVLPETCSVLKPRGADALSRETMKAWHHLWHSLGATERQIQCLILPNAEICMYEEAEAIEVLSPSFPRSLKTGWQGHNQQSTEQIRLRYPKPIAEILSNTHWKPWTQGLMWTIHGHDSFEISKGENAKCCPSLPQALSIKGDVTLGIPHSRPLGRKWRCVGVTVERPSPLLHTAPEDVCRDQASKDERGALAPPPFTPNEHYENSLVNCAYDCDHYVLPVGTSRLHLAHHVWFA